MQQQGFQPLPFNPNGGFMNIPPPVGAPLQFTPFNFAATATTPKRRPGRPKKTATPVATPKRTPARKTPTRKTTTPKRPVGRPRKATTPKRPVGRPRKTPTKAPGTPKRPKNAFMFFSNQYRPQVRTENPNLPITAVAAHLGAVWRGMTPAEKQPFEELAVRDRARYAHEAAALPPTPKGTGKRTPGRPRKTPAKAPGTPKRPLNAYLLFANQYRPQLRAQYPQLPITEVTRQMGAQWRGMGPEQKRPFEEQALRERERYAHETGRVLTPTTGGHLALTPPPIPMGQIQPFNLPPPVLQAAPTTFQTGNEGLGTLQNFALQPQSPRGLANLPMHPEVGQGSYVNTRRR